MPELNDSGRASQGKYCIILFLTLMLASTLSSPLVMMNQKQP